MTTMTPDEIRNEIATVNWYQQIELPHGIKTPGERDLCWDTYGLPKDLTGKTLLEIGSYNGGHSFEAEKRGAIVTSSDLWDHKPHGDKPYRIAHRILESKAEMLKQSVYDFKGCGRQWDVVFFIQVLYHLRHPLLALETVYEVTREVCYMETHVDANAEARPAAIFYPGAELCNDPSNWWGPNIPLLEAWFKDVGFRKWTKIWSVIHNHSYCRVAYKLEK